MAQREKTFKKPSYRVYKRILERCIRSKYDLLRFSHTFPGQIPVFWGNIEATTLPILIDTPSLIE